MTIALASALLSAIGLYGFGVMQETQNRNQRTAQIVYHAISEQQGQELYEQEEIAWVGEFFNVFSEQVNHSTVHFAYANADMLKSQSMPYSGDLPASEDEIVVQESFLDRLGYSNELGQTIQIPFSDGTIHDFKLTGILNLKTGDIGRYTAIISKKLVEQQYGNNIEMDYYIGLKDAQNMSEEEATSYASTLAEQLKISDDNVIVRSTYFNLKDGNRGSDMLFYFLIGFTTFIGSGIVIYSIFYISVASSIRNYGQLRTIGTTKRQIKKMVYREGKLLAAIGIPIGLVIGNVIGYFLVPAGWYLLITLGVTVGVGLFAFMIVMIAIRTPVKRAAAVSPLEALRYSDYKGKMKESSVLHRKITPASLAKMNLSRQKAKSILTIFSLSLGGVLVVLISTMLVSYDGVAEALIVAVIVVCFSLINLVNTTITNFLSRRQEIGMLQSIGLSKKQLIKMLCYEGLIYSVFATLVTLILGTGLGVLSVQVVVETMNPYFHYAFPWLVALIYLAVLLIVQFILISYTTGSLKKQSLVEQIRAME